MHCSFAKSHSTRWMFFPTVAIEQEGKLSRFSPEKLLQYYLPPYPRTAPTVLIVPRSLSLSLAARLETCGNFSDNMDSLGWTLDSIHDQRSSYLRPDSKLFRRSHFSFKVAQRWNMNTSLVRIESKLYVFVATQICSLIGFENTSVERNARCC